ncbi:MAG: PhoD-like phosphatase N-terminal domain-containing protein, partial [Nitrospiraceae bacterium]
MALATTLVTCAPSYRPGLPPDSPFAEDHALAHGVATGDVTSHSALVWFRTTGPAKVIVQWAPDGEPRQLPRTSDPSITHADHDFTATIRLESLMPATRYWYRVMTEQ